MLGTTESSTFRSSTRAKNHETRTTEHRNVNFSAQRSDLVRDFQSNDKNHAKNLNVVYDQFQIEKESINQKYMAAKRENEILHQQVSDLKQQLSEYQHREDEIVLKYNKLFQKYNDMKSSMKNQSEKQYKKQNKIIAEVQNHQSTMIDDILKESEQKTNIINTKTKEINENKIMINRLKNLVELQEKQLTNIKQDLTHSEEKYQNLLSKLKIEKQRHEEYAKSTSSALCESTQATMNYEAIIETLRNENNLLTLSNNQQKETIDKLRERLSSRKIKISQLTEALKSLSAETDELTKEKLNEQARSASLEQNIRRYQLIIQSVPSRINVFITIIEKLFKEILVKVESKVAELYVITKQLKDDAGKSKAHVLELSKQLGDVTKMFQQSTLVQKDLEVQRSKLVAEVENAASAICCLAGEDFPEERDVHSRLQKAVTAAEKLASSNNNTRMSSTMVDNYSEFHENFNEERRRLYDGLTELRSALKITKDSLIQSEKENSILRKEIASASPRKEVSFVFNE